MALFAQDNYNVGMACRHAAECEIMMSLLMAELPQLYRHCTPP